MDASECRTPIPAASAKAANTVGEILRGVGAAVRRYQQWSGSRAAVRGTRPGKREVRRRLRQDTRSAGAAATASHRRCRKLRRPRRHELG
jgi:hypothetical protein